METTQTIPTIDPLGRDARLKRQGRNREHRGENRARRSSDRGALHVSTAPSSGACDLIRDACHRCSVNSPSIHTNDQMTVGYMESRISCYTWQN